MYAITLHQPWAWAIAAGWKPVENRSWSPPAGTRDEPIAIHAGKTWDDDGAQFIQRVLDVKGELIPASAHLHGAIIAVVKLGEVRHIDDNTVVPNHWRPWFFGPYGWGIRSVRAIDPVPCRGYQRLWRLSLGVELEVLRRLMPTLRPSWSEAAGFLGLDSAPAPPGWEDDVHGCQRGSVSG